MTMETTEKQRLEAMYDQRVELQNLDHDGYAERFWYLRDQLLAIGGDLVVPPTVVETRVEALIRHGRSFSCEGTLFIEKEPSRCHDNVASLWRTGQIEGIGTGYALSEDGLWRQHSWGLLEDGRVVETTMMRVALYGLELIDGEAFSFVTG